MGKKNQLEIVLAKLEGRTIKNVELRNYFDQRQLVFFFKDGGKFVVKSHADVSPVTYCEVTYYPRDEEPIGQYANFDDKER